MSVGLRIAAALALASLLVAGCGDQGGAGDNGRLVAANQEGLHLIEPGSRLIPGTKGLSEPVWSPDGDRLAVLVGAAIYTMRPDGSDRRRVVVNAFSPSFSPDGKRLAFMRDSCESERDYNACTMALNYDNPVDLYTVNVDGSDLRRLTSMPGYDGEPAWSPDGKRIAFVGDVGLDLMNADGSHRRELREGDVSNPAWSPDGKSIVFDNFRDITVLDVESGHETKLTKGQGPDFAPAWSPDGKRIAFLANTECHRTGRCTAHEPWEVWVMNADGTDPRRVTKGGFGTPAWG